LVYQVNNKICTRIR